ncbi:hypothetical protein HDC94_000633 [Leifsonia sp. AK011]|uniref:hypothetical protein n=1 Tax=Leifsonia sp. AK011 TaxID=2723075 RepID=UPI0015C6B3D8|nr:hypothetical protein [Leifsonia sp. AK011]NYF09477.1 hypothetical protein [Leifsonia sp. AK011]
MTRENDVFVEVLPDSAVPDFLELCRLRSMRPDTFPSKERLTRLLASPGAILLGFRRRGRSELVGAAVVYLLNGAASRSFANGEWLDARFVEVQHLTSTAATSAYISNIVSRDGHGSDVASRFAQWMGDRNYPMIYARPATQAGRRLARRFDFKPVGEGHGVWSRPPDPDKLEKRVQSSSKQRLGQYDRHSAGTARVSRVLNFLVLILAVPLMVGTPLLVWIAAPALFAQYGSHVSQLGAPIAGTAATLGGLASTLFFLTAQLRVTGFRQYGMTAIYRARAYAPLLILTASTIGLSLWSLILNTRGETQAWAIALSMMALTSHALLVTIILSLSLRLVTNMDPVSLARHFALSIRGSDGSEWGVVRVSPSSSETGYKVSINPNRTNFGLRDPLMPIHELILEAESQRYGQILSVMAERITRIYRLRWTMQFPDAEAWSLLPSIGWSGRIHHTFWRRKEEAFLPMQDRLQLVLLILHYFRRVHQNTNLKAKLDTRRQAAQFVLARLAAVLVLGNQPGRFGRYLARVRELNARETSFCDRVALRMTRKSVASAERRRREVAHVVTHCIDAILGISVDYAHPASEEASWPHGYGEGLRGLIATVKLLHNAGYDTQAEHGARALAWIRAQAHSPLLESRIQDLAITFAAYPTLQEIFNGGASAQPPFSPTNPWTHIGARAMSSSQA